MKKTVALVSRLSSSSPFLLSLFTSSSTWLRIRGEMREGEEEPRCKTSCKTFGRYLETDVGYIRRPVSECLLSPVTHCLMSTDNLLRLLTLNQAKPAWRWCLILRLMTQRPDVSHTSMYAQRVPPLPVLPLPSTRTFSYKTFRFHILSLCEHEMIPSRFMNCVLDPQDLHCSTAACSLNQRFPTRTGIRPQADDGVSHHC